MLRIEGYLDFERICDEDEFILYRGLHRASGQPVLAMLPRNDAAGPSATLELAHAFALRDTLANAWAIRPQALDTHLGRPVLFCSDPGGASLSRILTEQGGAALPLAQCLQIAAGLAQAVAGMHAAGLIHRNLCPAHVMVEPLSGVVRLGGFGRAGRAAALGNSAPPGAAHWGDSAPAARQQQQQPQAAPMHSPQPLAHTPPQPSPATAPSSLPGNLSYIAPEQTGRMNRSVDERADLYSLGVILYRMLTGRLPFSASDAGEWIYCHLARPPAPPTRPDGAVPAVLTAMLDKLLAKTPEDRYQSASGLAADLRRCIHNLEGQAHPPSQDHAANDPLALAEFALGEHDMPHALASRHPLYGRAAEQRALRAAFERVALHGQPELLLIGAYSGAGKSALAFDLLETLEVQRPRFLHGKFDQLRRDIPYATLAQAIGLFVRQIVSASEAEVEAWRARLAHALADNGRLLVELAPELERLIGPQPALPGVPPAEAQNRFRATLRAFFGALASAEHPLVLFLDDLQWIDEASCHALLHLLVGEPVPHLLVLSAYRDNEVDEAHPLMRTVAQLRAAGGTVHLLALAAISRASVQALIGDVLGRQRAASVLLAPLATLVHRKTGGNPFFVLQFVGALVDEGLLYTDPEHGRWHWDIARVREKDFTDNVADLMVSKLRRLPQRALAPLRLLACLGHSAQLSTLALLLHGTPAAALADLRAPLHAGLIVHEGETVRFLHDRVREAAYSLIPFDTQPEVHLEIARTLLATLPPTRVDDHLFELLDLFNRGAQLLDDGAERVRLRELNSRAARRAKLAIAYRAALAYFNQAAALLDVAAWRDNYDEAFELHLEQAECAFLVGDFAASRGSFDTLTAHARSRYDHARIDARRLNLFQLNGDHCGAIAVALDGQARFGVQWPAGDAALQDTFERLNTHIGAQLAQHDVAALLDAPLATDADALMMLRLLGEAIPSAFDARPLLAAVMIAEAIRLSLLHGNAAPSCFAYSCYARWLISVRGDIPGGHAFSDMALRLAERFADPRQRGRQQFVHGAYIQFWREPIANARAQLEQSLATCTAAGDVVFACYTVRHLLWQLIEQGTPLEEVAAAAQRYMSFARQSHNEVVYRSLQPCLALVDELRAPAGGAGSLEPFDAPACLDVLVQAGFGPAIALFHVRAQVCAVILGDYATARQAATQAAAVLPQAMSTPLEATHHFYRALTYSALPYSASAGVQAHAKSALPHTAAVDAPAAAVLDEVLARYLLWARHSPANYQHRLELLRAEAARLAGDSVLAMRSYAAAIDRARAGGFIHEEALAAERAAYYYRQIGIARIASLYLADARAAYRRWGAATKLRQLETRDDGDSGSGSASETQRVSEPHDSGARLEHLDMVSVLKASHAVSQELVLERLVANLLQIAVQHAGADRGLLVLLRDGHWQVEAQAVSEDQHIDVTHIDMLVKPGQLTPQWLPQSALQYVARMREPLLLDDALGESPRAARLLADAVAPSFARDPYVLAERPRSLLCLPLIKQTRLVGALYLENKLAAGVFTRERIALLELLASQAAISLENATLFQDLQQENRERQRIEAELKQYGERLEGLVAARTAELEGKHDELAKAYRALDEQAVSDPLTGLHNRRFLTRCIGADISRTVRDYQNWLALPHMPPPAGSDLLFLLIDIDHFKQINDTYGHACGDAVLVEAAQRLRSLIRDSDYVVRWGGEEFLVVCKRAERATLATLAERLRCELSDRPYHDNCVDTGGAPLRISCSVGAACFPFIPADPGACDWERVIDLADRGLYAAKLSGRNGWVTLTAGADATRQTLLERVRRDTAAALAAGLIEVHTSLGDAAALRWHVSP
jgi:diguanylate cyclase (GGDEF)-like protein